MACIYIPLVALLLPFYTKYLCLMTIALALLIALILDAFLGEPKKGHPLVIFGAWASAIEKWLIYLASNRRYTKNRWVVCLIGDGVTYYCCRL